MYSWYIPTIEWFNVYAMSLSGSYSSSAGGTRLSLVLQEKFPINQVVVSVLYVYLVNRDYTDPITGMSSCILCPMDHIHY